MSESDEDSTWNPHAAERCFVFHGPVIYESTIKFVHEPNSLEIIGKKEKVSYEQSVERATIKSINDPIKRINKTMYYIHYKGWPKNWDEWVDKTRMLPYNQENIKKSKELLQTAINDQGKVEIAVEEFDDIEFLEKNVTTISNKDKKLTGLNIENDEVPINKIFELKESKTIQDFFPSKRIQDGTFMKVQRFLIRPPFLIDFPTALRQYLIDDCQLIKLEKKLVNLPSKISIRQILVDYKIFYDEKVQKINKNNLELISSSNDSSRISKHTRNSTITNNYLINNEFVEEFLVSLENYLIRSFAKLILYFEEFSQFENFKNQNLNDEKFILEIYGIQHFLRFLSILPSLISQSGVDDQGKEIAKFFIQTILDYLELKFGKDLNSGKIKLNYENA